MKKMINEIVKMKEKGLTLQQIADRMNLSIGKVQYRWNKYRQEAGKAMEPNSKKGSAVQEKPDEPLEHIVEPPKIHWIMPYEFDEDTLFAMVQSPTSIFVYWSISAMKRQMVEHHFRTSWSRLPKKMKIYDVTDIIFQGHNSHRSFEIDLPEMTNNWFLQHLEPDRTYVVDIGTQTFDGSFFTVLRSNPVETPRDAANDHRMQNVVNWKNGNAHEPEWMENFSSYSYYQKIR